MEMESFVLLRLAGGPSAGKTILCKAGSISEGSTFEALPPLVATLRNEEPKRPQYKVKEIYGRLYGLFDDSEETKASLQEQMTFYKVKSAQIKEALKWFESEGEKK